MLLVQKLKQFERQIVFLKWASTAEFVKVKYVGKDFIEVDIINPETLEYEETVLINPDLILEVVISGIEIGRVIAGLSNKIELVEE
ncbi:MAG: hypothetical protein PHE78_05110 [Candidatus Gastranaerophilales bacterium]|jgi:hypothetical protein|nr:hypothetical protein [Candidatus Gastranaerophilales bacterium]